MQNIVIWANLRATVNVDCNEIVTVSKDPAAIRTFAARAVAEYPSLNVLINNAGIMKLENLQA